MHNKKFQNIFRIAISYVILTALIFSISPSLLAAGKLDVKNIRVAKNDQVTRVVFDTSTPPKYKIFTLNNPTRVVIDLSNAKLATNVNQSVFSKSFVNKLRYAHREDGKLRLVLDLNQTSIPKSFVLPPNQKTNHRLVIDLRSNQSKTVTVAKVDPIPKAKKSTSAIQTKPVKKAIKKTDSEDIIAKVTKPAVPIKKSKPTIYARELVIAIDPGHGGKDPGAVGYAGTYEKTVNLQISKRLAKLVNAEPGMRAVLTRNNDKFLTLRGRMKLARDKGADLFVSIHADAVKDRRVRGSSVYVLSKNGASSEAAKILAKNQNSVDSIGGVELDGKDKMLQKVIVDLSQSATIDESLELAGYVKNELKRIGKTRERIESAGFAVLKSPDTPSILVETAFISNPSEEKKLRSATHQQKLAVSVFRGIKIYFQRNAPEESRYAHINKLDSHTIKNGETLSGIAVKYRVSLDSLRNVNSLTTDKIRVGQKLIIPEV
ncbi:MAG: N-acetylmuramoyl-L-alanine amidase [Pseudomonadota bacterium]